MAAAGEDDDEGDGTKEGKKRGEEQDVESIEDVVLFPKALRVEGEDEEDVPRRIRDFAVPMPPAKLMPSDEGSLVSLAEAYILSAERSMVEKMQSGNHSRVGKKSSKNVRRQHHVKKHDRSSKKRGRHRRRKKKDKKKPQASRTTKKAAHPGCKDDKDCILGTICSGGNQVKSHTSLLIPAPRSGHSTNVHLRRKVPLGQVRGQGRLPEAGRGRSRTAPQALPQGILLKEEKQEGSQADQVAGIKVGTCN